MDTNRDMLLDSSVFLKIFFSNKLHIFTCVRRISTIVVLVNIAIVLVVVEVVSTSLHWILGHYYKVQ